MHQRKQSGQWLKVLATTLLLVLAIFSTVQAIHFHASNGTTDVHCQLCLLAHHSVVPELQTQAVAATTIVSIVIASECLPSKSRVVDSARIRPPPESL